MGLLGKLFGDANERAIKSLYPLVEKISSLEEDFKKLSDEQLKAKTEEFRKNLADGSTLDSILPEAFAAVREAARRTLGQRHYDVQLMGGIVLHQGKIAQMRTGEGKTLVATLPVYLNALAGKGAHVVTVNDYLARRDTAWMGQIYNALGLTVGCINHDSSYLYDPAHQKPGDQLDEAEDVTGSFRIVHEFLRPVERRQAYAADITYGTNNEYGFDYLRDNLVYDLKNKVQRGHPFAIVDEVDSILIDEARTPLIISAPDEDSGKLYQTFSKVVPRLKEGQDYTVDEKLKAVSITDEGIQKVEDALGIKNLYEEGGLKLVHHLEQALKAQALFRRDKDYVVKDGEVIIVDEFTGRLMPGRRWSEGLHQAVEAKEGVNVQKESRTMATITFQNYFRLYKKLSGMTGTAATSAEEFHKVYNLDVVVVPTNKSNIRQDLPDRIFKNENGKYRAVISEIKERNDKGQPVLVGTASIEKNELLSMMLKREGIVHNLLNAKNHEKEAEIIAQAGHGGAVTIATNMAGRGVDIILGGNPPDPVEIEKVRGLGGLHVIGTEHHEARRIDDQLRGRAGRQGDPGSSQFFVSMEDEVIRIFGGDRMKNVMETLGVGEDDAIENSFISRAINQAQSKIEGHHFDSRKYVLEYDDVMNKHRTAVYNLRNSVLEGGDTKELFTKYIDNAVDQLVSFNTPEDADWDIENLTNGAISLLSGIKDTESKLSGLKEKIKEFSQAGDKQGLTEHLEDLADEIYEMKEKSLGSEQMRQLEKVVLLQMIDRVWVDHIEAMEYLRDSVRLRAFGQRDPLVEYKIEAQKMYDSLLSTIEIQAAHMILKVGFVQAPREVVLNESRPEIADNKQSANNNEKVTSHKSQVKNNSIGRNDPCPCGSGKKYKKCHGK